MKSQKLDETIDELLNVGDNKEYAMRLAYIVLLRDKHKYLSEIETDYRVEFFRERGNGEEKTRITIEF